MRTFLSGLVIFSLNMGIAFLLSNSSPVWWYSFIIPILVIFLSVSLAMMIIPILEKYGVKC